MSKSQEFVDVQRFKVNYLFLTGFAVSGEIETLLWKIGILLLPTELQPV